MNLAFIGGGGAGGVLLLLGLLILTVLAVTLLGSSVVLACMKKRKISVGAVLAAAALGYFPVSYSLDFAERAEARANRKTDFDVVIVASPPGHQSVLIDGVAVRDDDVGLERSIDFVIDFGDSRSLTGRCTSFVLRRDNGEIESICLNGITVPDKVRTAFTSSFPQKPPRRKFDGRTSAYTVWFTKVSPEFERFESIWR